ncbi:hypothetical protein G9P44_006189 [Scheffersomyces stipitis]|nr:hypothetical protein G9P44_006189 [Scheffersomyces stipitis]
MNSQNMSGLPGSSGQRNPNAPNRSGGAINIHPSQVQQLVQVLKNEVQLGKNASDETEKKKHYAKAEGIRTLLLNYQAQQRARSQQQQNQQNPNQNQNQSQQNQIHVQTQNQQNQMQPAQQQVRQLTAQQQLQQQQQQQQAHQQQIQAVQAQAQALAAAQMSNPLMQQSSQSPMAMNLSQQSRQPSSQPTPVLQSPQLSQQQQQQIRQSPMMQQKPTPQMRQSPIVAHSSPPGSQQMRSGSAGSQGSPAPIAGTPSIPANMATVERFNIVKQKLTEVQHRIQFLEQSKKGSNIGPDELATIDKELLEQKTKFSQFQKLGLFIRNSLTQQAQARANTPQAATGTPPQFQPQQQQQQMQQQQQFINKQNQQAISSPALQKNQLTVQQQQQLQQQIQQRSQQQTLLQQRVQQQQTTIQQQQQMHQQQQMQQQQQQQKQSIQQQQQMQQIKRAQASSPQLQQQPQRVPSRQATATPQQHPSVASRPASITSAGQAQKPTGSRPPSTAHSQSTPSFSGIPNATNVVESANSGAANASASAVVAAAVAGSSAGAKSVSPAPATGDKSSPKSTTPQKSQSLRTPGPPPINLAGITKPQVPSIPISATINVKPPTAVTLKATGDSRPTLTGGEANSLSILLNTPAITKLPTFELSSGGTNGSLPETGQRALTKRKLSELISTMGVDEGDGKTNIDGNVEELLLDLADEFINSVTSFSCRLAKHRKVDSIDTKDVQLHLERNWNIKIPGYAMDEIRSTRKLQPSTSYNQKVQGVEISRSVNGDING